MPRAKFGLAKDPSAKDILYLTGIVRMQVELPNVRAGDPRGPPQGLALGRVVLPPAKVQIIPPKSRDQVLYERRQSRQG